MVVSRRLKIGRSAGFGPDLMAMSIGELDRATEMTSTSGALRDRFESFLMTSGADGCLSFEAVCFWVFDANDEQLSGLFPPSGGFVLLSGIIAQVLHQFRSEDMTDEGFLDQAE